MRGTPTKFTTKRIPSLGEFSYRVFKIIDILNSTNKPQISNPVAVIRDSYASRAEEGQLVRREIDGQIRGKRA